MIFDNPEKITINPPHVLNLPLPKSWTSLGDGTEALVKNQEISPQSLVTGSSEIIKKTKKITTAGEISIGNLFGEEEFPAEAKKEDPQPEQENVQKIKIQVLLCNVNTYNILMLTVNSDLTLAKLAKKVFKSVAIKPGKYEFLYKGIKQNVNDTIAKIGVKENDKIACTCLGYDIKTFKRFKETHEDDSWSLSSHEPDAISFIAHRKVKIFGFGMYRVKEGPSSFVLKFELYVNDRKICEGKCEYNKFDYYTDEIGKIWLNEDHEPFDAPEESKITISVIYENFDNDTRIHYGIQGELYNNIEDNESGIFTVEVCSRSQNGTDLGSGQIPEIYYAIEN